MTGAFTPLIDALCRNRRTLLVLYVLLITACVATVVVFGLAFPEWLHALGGGENEIDLLELDLMELAPFLAVFILVHVAFLWGGGRVTLGDEAAGAWRLVLPVAAAVACFVVLVAGLAGSLLEMFDRFMGEGALRDEASSWDIGPSWESGLLPWLLIGSWLVWSALGVYLLRKRTQHTALSRLTVALLATSWVEFFVALPVDIAIRERADSCPCATGSWLALFFCVPILLFAFGPGLLLLYMREWRLAAVEPRRAMKILVRKTRRAPPKS